MPSTPAAGSPPVAGESPEPAVVAVPAAPAPPPAPSADARPPARPDALPPPRATHEFNVLCYTLLGLFVVSFGLWVIFAWTGYGKRYASAAEGWYVGGTRSIEITLVREDRDNLECASDIAIEGLHCGYRADQQSFDPRGASEAVRLRPYNTVDNVPFLGAGLWNAPGLPPSLPSERFTVTCNFRMLSTLKSVTMRWAAGAAFAPAKNALPVGLLSDCVIPR